MNIPSDRARRENDAQLTAGRPAAVPEVATHKSYRAQVDRQERQEQVQVPGLEQLRDVFVPKPIDRSPAAIAGLTHCDRRQRIAKRLAPTMVSSCCTTLLTVHEVISLVGWVRRRPSIIATEGPSLTATKPAEPDIRVTHFFDDRNRIRPVACSTRTTVVGR